MARARLKKAIADDGFALAVLSEGVSTIPALPDLIPRLTGVRLRYTKLGHAQRGADVSHIDRRLALDMARLAHQGLRDGLALGTIIVREGRTRLHEDTIAAFDKPLPDRDLYAFVNGLS